ncbi:MAG: metallophosphoesterase family protein [Lentilitoribacter sp.]
MKLAVIADIHGNDLALEAVLADIKQHGISDIVNLGDCFSGPLNAAKTADILIKHDFPTIRGNHDRYLIEQKLEDMGPSDACSYAQLEQHHIDWLRSLPETLIYHDDIFLCHGTPESDTTYWMERVTDNAEIVSRTQKEIQEHAKGIDCSLILCGHTHLPRTCKFTNGKMLVNPGSVGCPGYDDDQPIYHKVETGHPNASYAIVEKSTLGWDVTFRQIAYDHMKMSELAGQNGRPEWANALATGWL